VRSAYFVLGVVVVVVAGAGPAMADLFYETPLSVGWHPKDGGWANGDENFTVYRDSEVELGLKAHQRGEQDLPQAGGVYEAPAGTSWFATGGYDVAKWNFDASVFFLNAGSTFTYTWVNGLAIVTSGTVVDTFNNHEVYVSLDFDPAPDNILDSFNVNDLLGSVTASQVIGFQLSENLMFHYWQNPPFEFDGADDFNPYASGYYGFMLQTNSEPKTLEMTVHVVPVPAAILLCVFGLGTAGLRLRKHS
jgi:hypothetical protein